jgi:hypothetical protein
MRFRVAAIQDEGLPQEFTEARLWLEDWLNRSLTDADFGSPECCIVLVLFATSSLPRAPAVSRLVASATTAPTLALHIVIEPSIVERTRAKALLGVLCSVIVRGLPARPLRKPKGLEYERLRNALVACIRPFASRAA